LTAGGITARFSATGQGFSIQRADTMGFTPAGFSGNCVYPSSVFASDLRVQFAPPVSSFSLLYAPQELACDSSARTRVTAFRAGQPVGTSTTTADPPGTWPSATLAIAYAPGFDLAVVHYDAPPPTGGDWGPIFMADNLAVTPGPPSLRVLPLDPATLVLAWPASASGYKLRQNPRLAPTGWSDVTAQANVVGDENRVAVPLAASQAFYRLVQP
jgi:hypothetical protein